VAKGALSDRSTRGATAEHQDFGVTFSSMRTPADVLSQLACGRATVRAAIHDMLHAYRIEESALGTSRPAERPQG